MPLLDVLYGTPYHTIPTPIYEVWYVGMYLCRDMEMMSTARYVSVSMYDMYVHMNMYIIICTYGDGRGSRRQKMTKQCRDGGRTAL